MKSVVVRILATYRDYRRLQPPACRYLPTCSAYALEAVETHGAARGLYLALRRVLRCHPLGGHGHDPVPARKVRSCDRPKTCPDADLAPGRLSSNHA